MLGFTSKHGLLEDMAYNLVVPGSANDRISLEAGYRLALFDRSQGKADDHGSVGMKKASHKLTFRSRTSFAQGVMDQQEYGLTLQNEIRNEPPALRERQPCFLVLDTGVKEGSQVKS